MQNVQSEANTDFNVKQKAIIRHQDNSALTKTYLVMFAPFYYPGWLWSNSLRRALFRTIAPIINLTSLLTGESWLYTQKLIMHHVSPMYL